MSKRTIIKGTLILTVAGIATKLLGFYNRIFLTRLIGVKELGTYQLIFPIYMLAFSFCAQGISTAVTKQVSHYVGKNENSKPKYVFRYALLLSFILSLLVSLFINRFSNIISLKILKNSDCSVLLKIISTAVPFVALKACINSYFMGLDKPQFQGISHFIEQVIRILTAYILSIMWVQEKVNAKLAVAAVVSGEIAATLLAIALYLTNCSDKEKTTWGYKEKQKIFKGLLSDSIPITTTGLMLTMFSSFEAIILPTMLYKFYSDSNTAMEMYGIITGIVIPFLLLPSTVTTSLSTMLLPAVSFASAQKNNNTITKTIKYSVMFCFVLGVGTCILYTVLGKWVCVIAFKSEAAGNLLKEMCILCPFIYMSGNMSAILNGLDKAFLNLIFNIVNICIRIAFTITLVPIYGIQAYLLGMAVSYITLNLLMFISISRLRNKLNLPSVR